MIDDVDSPARQASAFQAGSRRRVIGLIVFGAVLVAAGVTVLPTCAPQLAGALRDKPAAPLLLTACWLLAASASVIGKKVVAAGHLTWRTAVTSHIGGTVANRVVPAGLGAAGVFIAALRRGGATTTGAVGVVALWAAASGVIHAVGLVLGVAWLRGGGSATVAALLAIGATIVIGRRVVTRYGTSVTMFLSRRRMPAAVSGALTTRLRRIASAVGEVVAAARARPGMAFAALLAHLAAMSSLAMGFATASAVVGVPVTATASVAAYLAGTALSASTATPAGIGSAEAALVGALVVAGAGVSEALPAVLLFRAVTLLAPVVIAALIAVSHLLSAMTRRAWSVAAWRTVDGPSAASTPPSVDPVP
ncbi:lysylphosphatidylglycerol synthase domain-containing protein [Phytoactinopolyspora halotolerans]|nr:lysylphosphatidylglycerol synthase domain-containing protein [Phytoactinopolyspora halotolerans]